MLQEKTKSLFAILAKKVFSKTEIDEVMREIKGLELEEINLIETDSKGNTALHLACMNNHDASIVKLLIDFKARIDAQNDLGKTSTHFAVCAAGEDNLRTLIAEKANLRIRNISGNNALHLASTLLNGENIARRLTDEHARDLMAEDEFSNYTNCQNKLGKTPLHIAAEFDNDAVLKVLLRSGANIEIRDDSGQTALDLATINHKKKAAYLLRNDSRAISKEIFEEIFEAALSKSEAKREQGQAIKQSPSSSPTAFVADQVWERSSAVIDLD